MRHEVTDKQFCEFTSMIWGFRAAFKLLSIYYNKHKCVTIRQIISRWAPPSENNTSRYIQEVCKRAQIDPDVMLPKLSDNKNLWVSIVLAMARVECAKTFPRMMCEEGYERSFEL